MARQANRTISIEEIGQKVGQEKRIVNEIGALLRHVKNPRNQEERNLAMSQINSLSASFEKIGRDVIDGAEDILISKSLAAAVEEENSFSASSAKEPLKKKFPSLNPSQAAEVPNASAKASTDQGARPAAFSNSASGQPMIQPPSFPASPSSAIQVAPPASEKVKLNTIEKLSLKRMKKKSSGDGREKKRERRPSAYMKISSRWFYRFSNSLLEKGYFEHLRRDLIKANIETIPTAYISAVFFSTMLSCIAAFFIFVFFLFLSVSLAPPFISGAEESILSRFAKVFWILVLLPGTTFIFGYMYPSLERKSLERKIDHELPFATIHMSAISSSMIEPSKLFGIIISTGEYPRIEKELIKLQNEINIYGYDLVTALRNRAFNSPSKKLSELFNGLATTITSGGNLSVFFEKRSQSLLFEYRLDMEKQGKAAETFMDIYISVVIASPMVLMLLLMMMRISGLGIALSPAMITVVIITAVTMINIVFLAFLQVRQQDK